MSVKLRFVSPAEGGAVSRSRSFAGFRALHGRRAQFYAVSSSSVRSRVPSVKSMQMYPASNMAGSSPEPQPLQVEKIFRALKKGLNEYLEAHQAELLFLTAQQKDIKRNSRLAFLYDLEKQIRMEERYVRRLEFHLSKVEELYESYCIQWRLCDGARNMKHAFSMSPSSRASRESQVELSRNLRECMEDMCLMERTLEILLGELRIRMKGLIGFARLCPGDQYEVFIRLGRQRWKIKGKIQSDDRQTWDSEEMVFLPLIHESFDIKVTELRGLSTVLVGVVTCQSANFFTARPQIMVVDITELGTIKLQMEVLWDPFHTGEVSSPSSPSGRLPAPSRKGSLYSWTPPSTPSFRERYFTQYQDPDSSFALLPPDSRAASVLNYLADSPQGSLSPVFPPDNEGWQGPGASPPFPDDRSDSQAKGGRLSSEMGSSCWSGEESKWERYSTPDILRENKPTGGPHADSAPWSLHGGDAGRRRSLTTRLTFQDRAQSATPLRSTSRRLAELLHEVNGDLQNTGRQDWELKRLGKQILLFGDILKNDLYLHKTSSMETLAVEEEVLGSFDFLSTDFNADELSCLGSVRVSAFREGILPNLGMLPQGTESRTVTERVPLTTGDSSLDLSLAVHLCMCKLLVQLLSCSDSSVVQSALLEELSLQADVLEKISKLSLEKSANEYSARDLVPKCQRLKSLLSFWDECTESETVFYCSTEKILKQLRKRFIHKVKAKQPGQADTVFRRLLEQILSSCRLVPPPSVSEGARLVLPPSVSEGVRLVPPPSVSEGVRLVPPPSVSEGVRLVPPPSVSEGVRLVPPPSVSEGVRLVPPPSVSEGVRLVPPPSVSEGVRLVPPPSVSEGARLVPPPSVSEGVRLVPPPSVSEGVLTVFQLFNYLQKCSITDFGEHLTQLSKEVQLIEALSCPKRRRALKRLKGKRLSQLQPLPQTLQLLAMLQTDENHKVCRGAAACLCRAAAVKSFRAKAIVYYTAALRDSDVQLQRAACMALKCLKAVESVEQIADLWRSGDEDLRNAAREAVLSFGKKGHIVFLKIDKICCELQEEAFQNKDTEITIL
ncbi:RIPOR family member 3 [Acipenser ruthenus]|uniref:RIPOR family member 3 n=1 Tax=Acipenser ruthenus TaxID=7906 RepID=UPI0027422E8C|nr:RIPOR family member 3 [Acipenser ruthenus]